MVSLERALFECSAPVKRIPEPYTLCCATHGSFREMLVLVGTPRPTQSIQESTSGFPHQVGNAQRLFTPLEHVIMAKLFQH